MKAGARKKMSSYYLESRDKFVLEEMELSDISYVFLRYAVAVVALNIVH